MSKSKRKTSVMSWTTARSEKEDKRLYNRRYRRVCKQILNTNLDCELLPHLREYSNPWAMGKDGKHWFDAAEFPEAMRK